jgi:hypothetical protein
MAALGLVALAGGVACALASTTSLLSASVHRHERAEQWAGHTISFLLSSLLWLALSQIPLIWVD